MPKGVPEEVLDTERKNKIMISDEHMEYVEAHATEKNVSNDVAAALLLGTAISRRQALINHAESHPRVKKERGPRAPRAKKVKAPPKEGEEEKPSKVRKAAIKAPKAGKALKPAKAVKSAAKPVKGPKGRQKKVVRADKKVKTSIGTGKKKKAASTGKGGKKKKSRPCDEEAVLQSPEEQGADYPRVGHDGDEGEDDITRTTEIDNSNETEEEET